MHDQIVVYMTELYFSRINLKKEMKKQREKRRGILRPSPNEAVSMSFLSL